jgi:hypothetical protein
MVIPSNGATLRGTVTLDGETVIDPSQVATFQYELTGGSYTEHVVATATHVGLVWLARESNGTLGWDSTSVPNGTYTLTPVVNSTAGAAVTVTVSNPAPTAQVLIPKGGATLRGMVILDGAASYPQNVTHFTYDLDGAPIATGLPTFFGWLVQWNATTVTNGSHNLTAVVTYGDGVTVTSPGVTVTVSNP